MQEHQRKQGGKQHLHPPVSAELQQLSCSEVVCPARDQFVKTLPPSFITTVNMLSSFRVTAVIQSDSSVRHSGALSPDPSFVPFLFSRTGIQNWVACTWVTVYFSECWRFLGLPGFGYAQFSASHTTGTQWFLNTWVDGRRNKRSLTFEGVWLLWESDERYKLSSK